MILHGNRGRFKVFDKKKLLLSVFFFCASLYDSIYILNIKYFIASQFSCLLILYEFF